ncbi:mersacidin family lantibiotic [Paenibacillus sp. FSL L8-0644]|uniref:mersacidin family lantibiotic n=1 Tax=Paenibacillus TaxID=44249 RepID=UPI000F926283|nr:mersacidin family lantibiotic [Paenibacillus polymyxa]KAF6629218.1 mersacidin/lichenicidin family type 2 lantibiotic [Paenibacillus sp. EKM208P]MDY7993231.1 mersacidin family lantibiotic [Paenibacillus polymyxa]MDY8119213.1 mersacidin family lantibiotic [Paenibacillus polymyxa]
MTKQEMIQAWKNPKLRVAGEGIEHPAGDALVELSADELARVHGGLGVQPDSTPTVTIVPVTITVLVCFPGHAG